jgi:hypothetical protein
MSTDPSPLLAGTLRNALATPFYKAHWAGIDVSTVTTFQSLQLLPFTDKATLSSAGPDAQQRGDQVVDEVLSRGTTASPFVSARGRREQEYIANHAFSFGKSHVARRGRYIRGLAMNDPHHGHSLSIPTDIFFHRFGVYDRGGFGYGRRVLQSSHPSRDVESCCTVLLGLEWHLRAFTYDTNALHPSGFRSHLDHVVSYGSYLTAPWERLLERVWRCPVTDRFSLSEAFGGATRWPGADWWFFDPYLIPEVVSPKTYKPITEGSGLLAVTTLFPFQEAQPLVRYLTGDIVAVTHENASCPGTLGIRPLGRMHESVLALDSSDWLVTQASLLELTESLPEIARNPLFLDAHDFHHHHEVGFPKYAITSERRSDLVCIRVTLNISPDTPTLRLSALKREVLDGLLRLNPPLRHALHSRTARIDIALAD